MKKRIISAVLTVLLLSSFPAAYAGKSTASQTGNGAKVSTVTETDADSENQAPVSEEDFSGVLASDAAAIDFLEGYWTNGRSDYIYAGRGSGELITWQMNLPYPACNQYILTDGVLTGNVLNEQGAVDSYEIFTMEIVDRNTLKVRSFYTGEETEFIRDSLTVDRSNISNEYVFWTMDRAFCFLEGEWMDADMHYITVSSDMQMETDLPCPTGMQMDFCDLKLCAYTMDSNGKKNFEDAYGFTILGKDTIEVHCYANDTDYVMSRITAEIDTENLDSSYVFFCDARAFSFLKGNWKEKDGDGYFTLYETDGNTGWKTGLPLEKHETYKFAGGGLVGVDDDTEGNTAVTKLYEIDILSRDEIQVHVLSDDTTHTLVRE